MDGNILAIDIGGSHIKGTILNAAGDPQTEYKKIVTPPQATAPIVIDIVRQLAKDMPAYDKVSVGFPGYVRNGIVYTAPNLFPTISGEIPLGQQIADQLKKPVRLVNDADQLGLGVVSGKGFELAVTLGTGFGTALLIDGYLLPHLELAHHPISKGRDYDVYIGAKALTKAGKKKWNKRMVKVLAVLKTVFNYDRLYIGGGNIDKLEIPLENNIIRFSNRDGIKGGARLWQLDDKYHISTNHPAGH
ncbi:ROK family protein [Puia sp.]|jgi:polyphosphate glucokinase|uniref:ROK family protein n=1 Tax=Puia sp. TaxID=2045100 RepID=UPI002F3F2EFF